MDSARCFSRSKRDWSAFSVSSAASRTGVPQWGHVLASTSIGLPHAAQVGISRTTASISLIWVSMGFRDFRFAILRDDSASSLLNLSPEDKL